MRARTIVIVELLYIVGICGFMFLGFLFVKSLEQTPGWTLGSALFRTITYAQAYLMFFVAALVAASAVSGEKEQKTFDSLVAAPVSPRSIVLTKLAVVIVCFSILVLVSMPFACTATIMGGVSPQDLFAVYGLTLIATALSSAIGIYWSTRFERAIAAIPAAAVCIVLIAIGGGHLEQIAGSAVASAALPRFLDMLGENVILSCYGHDMPFWVPSAALQIVLCVACVIAACGRMQFPSERSYLGLRTVMALFFTLVFGFGLANDVTGDSGCDQSDVLDKGLTLILVSLSSLAPWLGANIPVIHSLNRVRRSWVLSKFGAWWLLNPVGYSLLLLVLGAANLAGVLYVSPGPLERMQLVWLAYWSVVALSVVAWAQLAWLLGNRRTTRGRFIGMSIAYVAAAIFVVVPMIARRICDAYLPEVPGVAQYASLFSPFVSLEVALNPYLAKHALPTVVSSLGAKGAILLSASFYGTLNLLLLLFTLRSRKR